MTGFSSRTRAQAGAHLLLDLVRDAGPLQQHVHALRDVLVDLGRAAASLIVASSVLGSIGDRLDRKGENPATGSVTHSDDGGRAKVARAPRGRRRRRRRAAAGPGGRAARGRAASTRARRSARRRRSRPAATSTASGSRSRGSAPSSSPCARPGRAPRRYSASLPGHPPQLVVQPLGVGDVARERLLLRDRDPLGRHLERPRIDAARAVAQLAPDLARAARPRARRRSSAASCADRLDAERAASRSSARRPDARAAAGSGTARGTPPRGPGAPPVSPPGLRRSDATFATTFDVATPSEHESRVRARTTARTASASARASSNAGATSPRSRYPSSIPACSTVGTISRIVDQTSRE